MGGFLVGVAIMHETTKAATQRIADESHSVTLTQMVIEMSEFQINGSQLEEIRDQIPALAQICDSFAHLEANSSKEQHVVASMAASASAPS